ARGHVFTVDHNRPAEVVGEGHDGLLVARGRLAELMVEMDDAGDRQHAPAAQLAEEVRERHRVGAAGDGDGHPRAAPGQPMPCNEAPDPCSEIHAGRGVGERTGAGGRTRTVDPALMRRVLSPTELLRRPPRSKIGELQLYSLTGSAWRRRSCRTGSARPRPPRTPPVPAPARQTPPRASGATTAADG